MANCTNCGHKIGFFQVPHEHTDENGKAVILCPQCYEKCKIDEEKKHKIEEEEKHISLIRPTIEKYFSKCDTMKKVTINNMYSEKDIFDKFEDDSIEAVRKYFVNQQSQIDNSLGRVKNINLDDLLTIKKLCVNSLDFLNDLEKIFKIINKKSIQTNYPELISLFHDLFEECIIKESENEVLVVYKRILNSLKDKITVEGVLKEFIKSPFGQTVDTISSKLLLKKFNLVFDEGKLPKLIEELKEEIELENFEESLGEKTKYIQLPDYESLTGTQFESFLKKLFESLGYVVVQTKLSGDQGADLILMKDGNKTVVQAKKYSGMVSNKAIQEVVAAKSFYNCHNSMVVTTGEFTKSAIQLALSNGVDLWDKNKLQKIIDEINKPSKNFRHSTQTLSFSLIGDFFPYNCPYCDSKCSIPIEMIPKINERSDIKCPECGINLSLGLPNDQYNCKGCKKEFKTMRDLFKHLTKCEQYIERSFDCQYCKNVFILNDYELTELRQMGKLQNECPSCNVSNSLVRKG